MATAGECTGRYQPGSAGGDCSRLGLAGLVSRALPGSQIAGVTAMTGGTFSVMYQAQVLAGHGQRLLVIRMHGPHTQGSRDFVGDEAAVLAAVGDAGVPVPAVLYVDRAGQCLGEPALVLGHVEGKPGNQVDDPESAARQVASALAAIHAVPLITCPELPGLPPASDLPRSGQEKVLLHGDFWPGNTIWSCGRLAAIIDWAEAAIGDPLADVANARLETAWFWGRTAAETFTNHYATITRRDISRLPAWDRWVARTKAPYIARWGLPPGEVTRLQVELREFVARAEAATVPQF